MAPLLVSTHALLEPCVRRASTGCTRITSSVVFWSNSLTRAAGSIIACSKNGRRRGRVMNVGLVKVVVPRPLQGTPKTATIQRSSTGKWDVGFSCERAEPVVLPATRQDVGIDVGLELFAVPTQGEPIENPRFFRRDEKALAGAQRRLSKREKGTPERAARRQVVTRIHERLAWRRGDFAHQHSRLLVNAFAVIAVDDLSVNRMGHTPCLATSIHAAAWTPFAAYIAHQAAWAGRRFLAVNPPETSQDSPASRHRQPLPPPHRLSTSFLLF